MTEKPSEEEEKYFRAEDQRRIAEMRGELTADEATKAEWRTVAEAVGAQDLEVGRRLIELGFNTDTARILFFIPLIEVAWADGKIGYEESYRIVDVVRHRGIRATSAAYDFLSQLTLKQPSAEFFNGCNEVIRMVLAQLPGEKREQEISSLADLCVQVAQASRGFFGFGARVSDEERDAVQEIIRELGLENAPSTQALLKKLES